MARLRIDLVFSYWIYFWFILYVFKIAVYSPKFPLTLGLIYNIIMLVLMLLYGTSKLTIFYFIIINTVIKVIPVYYLRNEPFKMRDIIFTAFLFIIFILWLHLNRQSLFGNAKLIHDSLLFGQDKTPFIAFINQLKTNFKNLEVI
jgi:hypothetical protein